MSRGLEFGTADGIHVCDVDHEDGPCICVCGAQLSEEARLGFATRTPLNAVDIAKEPSKHQEGA